MSPLPRRNSLGAAFLVLSLAQMMMASSAMAMCQNAPCGLPSDWILSSPIDFAASLGAAFEREDGTGAEPASEVAISPTASRIKRSDEDGYTFRSAGVQLGGLREITQDTFVAYSLGYEDSRQRANDQLAQTDSRHYHAGLAVAREWGNWLAYGSLTYGHARHRLQRSLSRDAQAAKGRARVGTHQGALGAGVAYRVEGADWYLEPGFGLALLYEHTPGYEEHGLGDQDQHVKRDESLKAMLMPAIEFGRRTRVGRSQFLYWVSAGLSLMPDNSWATRSHAAGRPDVELASRDTMPSAIGVFQIGAVLAGEGGWSLHGQYGWQTGSHYRGQSGALRLAWAF